MHGDIKNRTTDSGADRFQKHISKCKRCDEDSFNVCCMLAQILNR